MSKKIQTAVICALLAGRKFVFDDPDTIMDIYGLGPQMFNVENPHLTPDELASVQAMMSDVEKARSLKERYSILEGTKETAYAAGRAALNIWCKRQMIHNKMGVRIDAAWHRLELTPVQLINESPTAGFPDVRDADPAKEDIALALFGDCALSTTLRGDFRDALTPIIHHNWERHRKVFKRVERSYAKSQTDAKDACQEIENAEKVTSDMLRKATAAVKKLGDALQWLPHEVEAIHGIAELEEFLKQVVVTAVAKAKGIPKEKLAPDIADPKDTPGVCELSSAKRGRARASKIKNVSLSAAGDVDTIWPVYVQLFRTIPTEPDPPAIEFEGAEDDSVWGDSNDLGVESFRNCNDAALNTQLRFPDGRPPLFAEFRSISRKCAWDDGAADEFVKDNPDMLPLSLLWHQRVGIASIIEKMWLDHEEPDGVPGMLIADEVGVGKTALVMGTIAFMMDTYWREQYELKEGQSAGQSAGQRPPEVPPPAPIISTRPYFAGQKSMPNLPHIIIVPNSLLGQWGSELRTFFAPKTIEIYVYPTAEKDFAGFWTGPWAKSAMPLINRIILVTHSVFTTQGKAFDIRKGKAGHNSKKASDEKRHVKNNKLEHTCIWHKRRFGLCAVDEGHEWRNQTGGWYAVHAVLDVAFLRLITTATPLFTGPKDLCNIGRLLRIPGLMGFAADDREAMHWKKLLAARRVMTQDDKEVAASHTVKRLAGSKSQLDEPISKIRVRQLTSNWIAQIRKAFAGRVIRRTVDSRRFDGTKINDSLPPYKMMIVPVSMDAAELAVLESGMKSLASKGKLGELDDPNVFNSTFYLESRTKVAFPYHDSPIYPAVRTLDQYYEKRSTKVETLMTILRWHLSSDANGVYRDLDKKLTDEEQQQLDEEYDPATDLDVVGHHALDTHLPDLMKMGKRKILVFMEFPMMAPLLISALALSGSNTIDERNDIIHKFNTVPEHRVLLFSTVGAVGLNLTVATVVILFDQCWSRMLVNQIIGRAWRLGQVETVLVYNMVALGTVDVLMVDHGEGKGKMLGQFLDKNQAVVHTIQRALTGQRIRGDEGYDENDDDDDEEDEDEITLLDGPPRTSRTSASAATSAAGSSRNSTSAASRQSATSTSDKSKPKNKVARTYGGKQQARNIERTGDDNGDFIDRSTIEISEDDEDGAPSKSQRKFTGKGKGKQVIVLIPPPPTREVNQPATARVKAEARAKVKGRRRFQDQSPVGTQKEPDMDITGSQEEPSIPPVDNAIPPVSSTNNAMPDPRPSSPTPASSSMPEQTDVDPDSRMQVDESARPESAVDLPQVNDQFALDAPGGTQTSMQDSMDVEDMLGDRGMANLRLTPGDDDGEESDEYPPWNGLAGDQHSGEERDSENLDYPPPWGGLSRPEHSGGQKRRRDTVSTMSVASPKSGPLKSPPRVRPPRKKVLVGEQHSGVGGSSSPRSISEGASTNLTLNGPVTVPASFGR
ncbi:hypothetical protein DEU56DRAFT_756342 [Suillus clintonianus]|uniref:uncharacterized protein n=1 Tax=Suillus clintonianus TaxID=1904413 RepID=UPI001B85E6B7|nr:uncharacterized protein DEU56DRAFT_756342 [Suillus clintonianus]KAG2136436.1 hypothetical protein DEU56DRAFT_756342 [Suillus clintonianus]